jgi:hypothetical protein
MDKEEQGGIPGGSRTRRTGRAYLPLPLCPHTGRRVGPLVNGFAFGKNVSIDVEVIAMAGNSLKKGQRGFSFWELGA